MKAKSNAGSRFHYIPVGATAISFLLSVLFSVSNLTGDIAGGLNESNYTVMGVIFFLVGVLGLFVLLRHK